jgi:hypothetical protein
MFYDIFIYIYIYIYINIVLGDFSIKRKEHPTICGAVLVFQYG